jgi:hypothetical protein
MRYFCCNDKRREMVRDSPLETAGPDLNGIDYLEVYDNPEQPDRHQKELQVHFIKSLESGSLAAKNVVIEGGERIRNISVEQISIGLDGDAKVLIVDVDKSGDFSIYTLKIVGMPGEKFDPLLSAVDFSFKVTCPTDLDCLEEKICPTPAKKALDIDYLAKDYASFRRVILDRMSALMPHWGERNPSDLGVVLAEILAYIGDYLSYRQDAISTEAYLGTARSRVSVKRHARLVDYFVHEGCNSRVWVQVKMKEDAITPDGGIILEMGSKLLTSVPGTPTVVHPDFKDKALAQGPEVFETMHKARLFPSHNEIQFYTWGSEECCLPKGATKATLLDDSEKRLRLRPGDVLVFEERVGPESGIEGDADPARRHAVRIIKAEPHLEITINKDAEKEYVFSWGKIPGNDEERLKEFLMNKFGIDWVETATIEKINNGKTIKVSDEEKSLLLKLNDKITKVVLEIDGLRRDEFIAKMENDELNIYENNEVEIVELGPMVEDPLTGQPIVEIEWHSEDALPFPLCISTKKVPEKVSHALGNIVLADHGLTLRDECIGMVPQSSLFRIPTPGQDRCVERKREEIHPRFRPRLKERPLTYAGAYVESNPPAPAKAAMIQSPSEAIPEIRLRARFRGVDNGKCIDVPPFCDTSGLELLPEWMPAKDLLSFGNENRFVVEAESDGTSYLRFGDGIHGSRPPACTEFFATYRVGNGSQGNIGAEALEHILSDGLEIEAIDAIEVIRNPMPAQGGADPESIDEVRINAPVAFRTQERAVTEEDYAEMAGRHPGVQRTAATLRWTGSWHTVFLTVDRRGGLDVDADFEKDMLKHIEHFRMAGHDLEVDGPRFVSLEVEMKICVKPDYFRSDVKRELLRIFSSGLLSDGRRGIFHPDNFTFGQPVYVSTLIAAAQKVPGVASVQVFKFQRQGLFNSTALKSGVINLGRLEVARLENDPNFPEHGTFGLIMEGGK